MQGIEVGERALATLPLDDIAIRQKDRKFFVYFLMQGGGRGVTDRYGGHGDMRCSDWCDNTKETSRDIIAGCDGHVHGACVK
jgi:hypothetical protein